eukprot:TRINITY_DN10702_c0_g1_i1.p1 TRINITY_DN10702_c0_g1~~TRINITY_DN10702_c0_g1_i1.p1  ORF type:complete len:118 (+),score=22.46 TRINITY_DN10702_c0_g1_i1:48-401(+)
MENNSSKTIPIPVRSDGWRPKPKDLSETPGGTLFAFTPGGTRIVYDRESLLVLSQSPFSRTPLLNLPKIPGVTVPESSADMEDEETTYQPAKPKNTLVKNGADHSLEEEDLFHFDGV